MIKCGTDIIEISRIKQSVSNPRFLSRVFSKKELDFFDERNNAIQTIAVNFCAKEAFSKALGTGIRGISLNEISTLRDELGSPYIVLDGKAKEIANKNNFNISVSLSHSDNYATAVVIIY